MIRTLIVEDDFRVARLHAEIVGTNRLRSISFAIALTPVRKEFFERGAWKCDGRKTLFFLCGWGPFVVLRVTGDSSTVADFGGGVAIFVNKYFQLNGGLLIGTKDISSGWRAEERWFVGVGIDPLLLAEAISAQPGKGK